ncbi:uncharacterized protein LOC142357075, partial [Convolutriloba macropyga]|uniref:uncharacterized protein LOC142357075 n=1 Tax=Convolutriloba macropyga TaxID=536237 RepID=UPI003F51EF52
MKTTSMADTRNSAQHSSGVLWKQGSSMSRLADPARESSLVTSSDCFTGQLKIKQGGGKGWKTKFCALNKDVALLSVYKSESHRLHGRRQNCFHLLTSVVDIVAGTNTQFSVADSKHGKTCRFKAESLVSRAEWVDKIRSVVEMHSAVAHQRKSIAVLDNQGAKSVFLQSRQEVEKHLQSVMAKRKALIHRTKYDNTLTVDEQRNIRKFFEVSRAYIDAVIEAVNKVDETKVGLDHATLGDTSTPHGKTPKLVRMQTWSDTQTEWFDAKSQQDDPNYYASQSGEGKQGEESTSDGEPSSPRPNAEGAQVDTGGEGENSNSVIQ